jgi:uncharacterized SAM-binding protein YcdF (DUF218 family)
VLLFWRWTVRVVAGMVGLLVLYLAVTFGQVWLTGRRDEARPSEAIVVFGAAQYQGRPSAVLRARLDHAAALWKGHQAPVIVVTGGKREGDTTTEASASAQYLLAQHHVPDAAILRITNGANSWESLAAAARELRKRGWTHVLLVSDPFHAARIKGIASELHLDGRTSPTRTSPIHGMAELRQMGKETIAVGVGRIIGYRRLTRVERVRAAAGTR